MSPRPSRWTLLQQIFDEALSRPAHARPAFLDAACAGDADLRAEIEDLLANESGGMTFAERAVEGAAASLAHEREQELIGRRIGAWKVTGIAGRGGMGAVFAVERADGAYQQRAALKLLHRDLDTAEGRRRFAEERQILAQLQHPNIARLLDGGSTDDGRPYIVMEYVDGSPIHEYADERGLDTRRRVRLMVTVCNAVHAAHGQLVIHRDLKPANVLVSSDGTVKLLDFGIARLLDPDKATTHTIGPDLRFSPPWASPEQVRGDAISTATDVYSLGAVLFHLLTGRAPRDLADHSLQTILREVCERPFPVPSASADPAFARHVRGDLDTIVAVATHPDPVRRYPSAERLAADLTRYLEGRPITARRDDIAYRAGKFLRRHAVVAVAISVAVAALISATVYSTVQARRAERRFAQVRQLASKSLFEIHDRIRDLQGSTAARESVARTALSYLDSLAAESRGDRALELELAAAYEKVAAVQFETGTASLGRPKDAQQSYRRAIEIRQRWLEREPSNAVLHAEQAGAYLHLTGAIDAAAGVQTITEAYSKGLEHGELARKLARKPSPQVLSTLARLYRARGNTQSRLGDLKGAVENYRSAVGIEEEIARSGNPEARAECANGRIRLALGLYNNSQQTEARDEFRRAVSDLEALAGTYPENRRYRRCSTPRTSCTAACS